MVTAIIIITILICIWVYKAQVKEEKKVDVVDSSQRANAIRRLQPVKYNFYDKSEFGSVMRTLSTFDTNPLSILSYSDQFLFVKYKDGQNFTANLDQIEVLFRFEPASNSRIAIITLGGHQFSIMEYRNDSMTEREWDTVFNILQCAKITHQRAILTPENRAAAIQQYQTAKMMRNMRRIQGF